MNTKTLTCLAAFALGLLHNPAYAEYWTVDALVKEFMEFARDQQLNLRAIKLPQLLQDIINLWQPVAAERDITLALEAEPFKGHALSDFEYLDLRFGDRLYYKLKSE